MGLRGCVQLWLGQGEVPELGPLWSPAGSALGFRQSWRGCSSSSSLCHFPFSPDGPALWVASHFLGSRVWVGAPSWAEKGGTGQAVSVSSLRASSRPSPTSTTPRTRGTRP